MRIRILIFLLVLLVVQIGGSAAQAETKEGQIKAALLYNFAQLVKFPDSAFSSDDAPLVIALLGDTEFQAVLEKGVNGKKAGRHPLVVKSISSASDAKGCQVIYIAPEQDADALSKLLSGLPVLTVAESETFLKSGGIIRFMIEDNKVRFRLNLANAEKAQLKLDDKIIETRKALI